MIILNSKQKKNITFLVIGFFIIWIIIIPLILQIPIIKQIISFLFSFTDNIEYKTVYIELTGAIMGSFLAIYGAFQLYLDFINIFIRLLQLFGRRND